MTRPMDPREAVRLLRDPQASFGQDVSLRIAACIEMLQANVLRLAQAPLLVTDGAAPRGLRMVPQGKNWEEVDAVLAGVVDAVEARARRARDSAAKARQEGAMHKHAKFTAVGRAYEWAANEVRDAVEIPF